MVLVNLVEQGACGFTSQERLESSDGRLEGAQRNVAMEDTHFRACAPHAPRPLHRLLPKFAFCVCRESLKISAQLGAVRGLLCPSEGVCLRRRPVNPARAICRPHVQYLLQGLWRLEELSTLQRTMPLWRRDSAVIECIKTFEEARHLLLIFNGRPKLFQACAKLVATQPVVVVPVHLLERIGQCGPPAQNTSLQSVYRDTCRGRGRSSQLQACILQA
mmetsp:Transcript_70026/g.163849  ORF Transcript_70026/g.163849 Transcript_70026/m.163849 type:complete len:218 (+) Transcript_70026:821-1474(+)